MHMHVARARSGAAGRSAARGPPPRAEQLSMQMAVLLLALLLPAATSLSQDRQQQWQQQRVPAAHAPPQERTVMSWVVESPPWNQTSHFILRGAAKGAVNAISVGLGWGFNRAPNGSFSFVADAAVRKQS